MSLYAQYAKERRGLESIEIKEGFVTFKYLNELECFIESLFIIPEKRKKGFGTLLGDEVVKQAKEKGRKYLTANVDLRTNGAGDSMKVLLCYKMKPYKANGDMVSFIKEI